MRRRNLLTFWAPVWTLSCLVLTGCYELQTQLLNPAMARQPAPATDVIDSRQGVTYHEKITPRSDGLYDFDQAVRDAYGHDGTWNWHTVLLNDLGTIRGHVLYAYGTWDTGEKAVVYGIMVFKGENTWQAVTPSCARNALGDYVMRELVIAYARGASLVNRSSGVCEFSSSDMLMSSLRDFANTDDFWIRANSSE